MRTRGRVAPREPTALLTAVVMIVAMSLAVPSWPLSATERAAVDGWDKPRLNDVTVVATDDVWVVGQQRDATGATWPLILHRDDVGWAEIPFARDGWDVDAWLVAVDAAAPDDVWAVGNYEATGWWWHPLILHFDGTAWTRIPAPGLHNYVKLTDVVAIDPTYAFAVGRIRGDPLVLGWDGSTWTRQPFQQTGKDQFEAADASGGTVWVTGGSKWYAAPQAYRFAGDRWTMPQMPSLPDYAPWFTMDAHLFDVEIQRVDHVWAVGSQLLQTDYGGDFLDNRLELVVERWDGHRWRLVPTPKVPGPFEEAVSVASTKGVVWVAGYRSIRDFGRTRALVSIRTGDTWWTPRLPASVAAHRSALTAVDGLGRRTVWAVGTAAFGPLILRGAGGSWIREL